jgi:hypothetical protein
MLMACYTAVMSTTSDQEAVVVAKGDYSGNGKRRKLLVGVVILIAVIVIGSFVFYMMTKQSEGDKLKQSSLQNSLTSAENRSSDADIIKYATELIDGHKKGSFVIADKTLGNIYLARATSSLNTKNYKLASTDFPQAGKLNTQNKKAALQGEIESRYRLGERKQLISLYQELIEVTKKSDTPNASSSIMQYEGAIKNLQDGKDIDF